MDELNKPDEPIDDFEEEEELSITDKLVGIITEPKETFLNIAKYPLKTVDWFLPVLLVSILSIISVVVLFNDQSIVYDFEEKASLEIEKSISEQIETGQITEEQAEMGRSMGLKWASIATYIMKFIIYWFILFLSALIYWLIIKFGFKDEGTYKAALVALGLPFYIFIVQIIVTIVLAYATSQYLNSPNLAEILGMNPREFPAAFLVLIDVFMIWYFVVVSIGLYILFKAQNINKYYILTFGVWIGLTLLSVSL